MTKSHAVKALLRQPIMSGKIYQWLLCSYHNTVEYEAYLIGLAIALKMGIKHLKVIGDSNLVVSQDKGSFSLKEPSLALYRTLA